MAKKIINTLGASNLSDKERAKNDYYATDPACTKALMAKEAFTFNIWEPTAGHHIMSDVLEKGGYKVRKSDLVDYGFNDEIIDFLHEKDIKWDWDLVFNPPYSNAQEFVLKALDILKPGRKAAIFLRTLFLEGQKRYKEIFKDNPPKTIYVFSKRYGCSEEDKFPKPSAVSYSWFIWEKGYKGETVIKWITE